MKFLCAFMMLTQSVTAAPAWVPPHYAEAFDRVLEDSETYEAILRADYEVASCEVGSSVRVVIRRASIVGELFLDLKAQKCEFSKNRFSVTLKPVESGFPWKEVIITGLLCLAAGFAAGASR